MSVYQREKSHLDKAIEKALAKNDVSKFGGVIEILETNSDSMYRALTFTTTANGKIKSARNIVYKPKKTG